LSKQKFSTSSSLKASCKNCRAAFEEKAISSRPDPAPETADKTYLNYYIIRLIFIKQAI